MFDAYPDAGLFDRDVLVTDATYNFEIFGYYGLSLWLVSESWPLDRVLAEKYRRAGRVVMFEAEAEAEALQSSGLGLAPSGRDPLRRQSGAVCGQSVASVRVTASTAEELVDRVLSAAYPVRDNEFHDQGQD